ncbi:hypothetical protein E4U53_006589 [Claviceps sorghi]|nr:hypothetical protein E4U53_006589 [Claviceps sorghi]
METVLMRSSSKLIVTSQHHLAPAEWTHPNVCDSFAHFLAHGLLLTLLQKAKAKTRSDRMTSSSKISLACKVRRDMANE